MGDNDRYPPPGPKWLVHRSDSSRFANTIRTNALRFPFAPVERADDATPVTPTHAPWQVSLSSPTYIWGNDTEGTDDDEQSRHDLGPTEALLEDVMAKKEDQEGVNLAQTPNQSYLGECEGTEPGPRAQRRQKAHGPSDAPAP